MERNRDTLSTGQQKKRVKLRAVVEEIKKEDGAGGEEGT